VEEPELTQLSGSAAGAVAACHFPLTPNEVADLLPPTLLRR
jgi:hypothetical protein